MKLAKYSDPKKKLFFKRKIVETASRIEQRLSKRPYRPGAIGANKNLEGKR